MFVARQMDGVAAMRGNKVGADYVARHGGCYRCYYGAPMKKKPIRIFDEYGNKLFQIYVDDPSKGFVGLRLDAFHVPYAKLPAMNFSGCEMYQPILEGADLSFCNFQGAALAGANLNFCTLRRVNFRQARFTEDAFGNRGSMLGADLTDALLNEADFHGVIYDDETIFPDGFDPVFAGLSKVDQ